MSQFRHFRFLSIALLALLCLLGMQYGAAKHGLTHFASDKSTEQQKHSPHEKTCDKCLVYAEIGNGAPTSSYATKADITHSIDIADSAQQPIFSRHLRVYFARGPPLSV